MLMEERKQHQDEDANALMADQQLTGCLCCFDTFENEFFFIFLFFFYTILFVV